MVDLGARARGEITRIAVVMDVRSRAFTDRPRGGHQGPGRAAATRRGCCSSRPPTPCWSAGSSRCAAATRCRATAGWPTASTAERELLAPAARGGRPRRGHLHRHGAPAAGQARARVRRRARHRARASPWCPSATSTACRWTPTSSIDVRFLPNPFWIPELRDRPAGTSEVRDYVLSQEGCEEFLDRYLELLRPGRRRLPARGQALPHARGRLHRRQAPQRGHQRGDRAAAGRAAPAWRSASRTATWGASERTAHHPQGGRARRRPRAARHALGAAPAHRRRHGRRHRRRRRRLVRAAAPRAGPAAAGRPAHGDGRAGRATTSRAAAGARSCSTASAASARSPATRSATCCSPGLIEHAGRPGRGARRRGRPARRARAGAADVHRAAATSRPT